MRGQLILLSVFLFLNSAMAFAASDFSQKTIKLTAGKYQFQQLFEIISKQSSCVFSYDPKIIDASQKISIKQNYNASITDILNRYLPKNINFKFIDKYILLLKAPKAKEVIKIENPPKPAVAPVVLDTISPIVMAPTIKSDTLVELVLDTLALVEKTQQFDTTNIAAPISTPTLVEKELNATQEIVLPPSLPTVGFSQNALIEFEISQDLKQFSTTFHAGISALYGIVSLSLQAQKVRARGLGLGTAVYLSKRSGVNLEFLSQRIVSGQTYDLGVKVQINQFRTEFNYAVSPNFKLFAGPTFSILKSTYVISETSYDLGNVFSYGAIIGFKFNIFPSFVKKV